MRKFILEPQTIMTTGSFYLRGWKSNLRSAVQGMIHRWEKIFQFWVWNGTDSDTLSCKIQLNIESDKPVTKRMVLAVAHQVFDPIGFASPVMLIPKLILQETWDLKLKWDEILPGELIRKFKRWVQQLNVLSEIKLPR